MLDLLNTRQREIRVVMRVCAALVTIVFLFGLPDSLVQSSIRLATPFVLGSLGALLASRAGVLNLAIEGKMLLGAFVGVAILFQSGLDPLVGVVAATVSGGILGLVFAILYLRIRINLIILALAVNLLVANGTVFSCAPVLACMARWRTPALVPCQPCKSPSSKTCRYWAPC